MIQYVSIRQDLSSFFFLIVTYFIWCWMKLQSIINVIIKLKTGIAMLLDKNIKGEIQNTQIFHPNILCWIFRKYFVCVLVSHVNINTSDRSYLTTLF